MEKFIIAIHAMKRFNVPLIWCHSTNAWYHLFPKTIPCRKCEIVFYPLNTIPQ